MARGGFPGLRAAICAAHASGAEDAQQMMRAQEDLDAREYEGTAGGGAVSCKVSGKRQLLSLTIDKDAVDPEEVEMLQDMLSRPSTTRSRRVKRPARARCPKSAVPAWAGCFNHGRAD